VVRELLNAGHHVRALVRLPEKARQVLPADRRITLVAGEVLDRKSPAALVAGADACIHLIGIIRETASNSFKGMHETATRAMLDACGAASVKRFVHMSAMGVIPDGKAEYQRTKYEGEQMVRRSGLDWTIFRPGLIHGVDGEMTKMMADWSRGRSAPFFFMPYFTRLVETDQPVILSRVALESARIAPVHVGDVARAFVTCLRKPESISELYNLSGSEEMDWPTMLGIFRDTLPDGDRTLPILGLPALPHAYMALVAKRIGLGGLFPYDAGQAFMAENDATADCGKAAQHLGFNPISFTNSVGAYAAMV